MPQTVLGLDIGSFSIKAALFETTFRIYELTDLFESSPLQADEVDLADRPVIITEAILRLLKENHLAPDTTVTALSGLVVSTRKLNLPLPENQVSKVLPFELESYIPFDLDEIIVDHHVISSSKTETSCLAAAVKKTTLDEHLNLVRNAGLEPAFVSLNSISLYNLNLHALKNEKGSYAILDIGHQKTSVCIVSNQSVQYVRTLFTAGMGITEAIRKDLDLTLNQALEVKHNHSILELENHPLKSDDLKRLSASIRKALDPLIQEILQTLHSYRSQRGKTENEEKPIERIYLCGGTSMIRNLPEYLSSLTNLPVSRLMLFDDQQPSKRTAREPILAQAVALGLRAAARGANARKVATINFRKGDFAFARDLSGYKEKAFFFGKWVLAIFCVALLQVGLKYHQLSQQKAEMDKIVVREFRKIVTDVKKPPRSSSSALRLLKAEIQKYRQKQEILTAGLNEMTALGVLREISTRIPSEIAIDAQELSIDRNKVTLRARTDSFESVDKIISALKEFPKFDRIEKGDIREAPDGKKAFQLTLLVGEQTQPSKRRRGR